MKGLMCQSTAVCSSREYRSVVVPDRMNKYVRIGVSPTVNNPKQIFHPSITHRQPAAPFPSSHHHLYQVVVMRVSIHCQGCASKLKKHLSKMQGVTSFSIDLENKRVTVTGHVSPSGVLESISKVNKAEFWSC